MPLMQSCRDDTRTAYILQAVESAWEGVERRKTPVIKSPPPPMVPDGASAMVENAPKDSEGLDGAYHLEYDVSMELCGQEG